MEEHTHKEESLRKVSGLYKDWFLDYASYVILDRAIPSIFDGFKPVQRRIMHSMRELEDGRYNKVANVVGNTMKYHPHGDASITDAMVQIGQKELLIDTQGNWGLGEISPDEFKHFIGKDIRLEPVVLGKDQTIENLLEFYMGKNTPDRQMFILENLVVEEANFDKKEEINH